jgi:CTP:molybdopterin cytidylyltransferase MocA
MNRLALGLLSLVAPVSLAAQGSDGLNRAVASITAEDVRHRIGVIADDSMMGRDTPSPGLDMTAHYIADEFRRMGLAPGGDDGGYIQYYPVHEIITSLRVTSSNGGSLIPGESVVQVGGGSAPDGISGPVIIVNGSGEPAATMSLAGAIVVQAAKFDPQRRGLSEESQTLLSAVQRENPAAIILLADIPDGTWRFFARQGRGRTVVSGQVVEPEGMVPLLMSRQSSAQELLGAGTHVSADGAPAVRRVKDLTVAVTATRDVTERRAPNVVGILEGSDPELKNEYVIYSGHMDHVGVGRAVDGDSIYNGADDDASGTVAVIEAAEAFAMLNPRPRRSMIFLLVSGEEKGLWGSAHFAENPSVPLSDVVADLNADMVGRNWPDTIVVIGKEHSDLGATLNRVNAEHPELGMTAIDDIWPNERFYFRSDHYNFARRGVPILFFFNGTHPDYHRPSDSVEKIDADKEARIVQLLFYLGLEVANAEQRPQWDPDSYNQIVRRGTP